MSDDWLAYIAGVASTLVLVVAVRVIREWWATTDDDDGGRR